MNKQQIKGVANEVAGKVQKEVGDLTDSPTQEAKGLAKEVKGKAQQAVGNAKEDLKDADRAADREVRRDDSLKR
jgi:uncharacterized protein YjbJ (UPF0337 family)